MSNPAQVIRPPNTLRMKVGGSFGGIDAGALAKAEQALQALGVLDAQQPKLAAAEQQAEAVVDGRERRHDVDGRARAVYFVACVRGFARRVFFWCVRVCVRVEGGAATG